MTTGTSGSDIGVDTEQVVGAADEVREAVMACDFPLLVWQFPRGVVQLGNEPANELFGLAPEQLIGRAAVDLMGPGDAVGQTIRLIESGAVDNTQSVRMVVAPTGRAGTVRVWTRAIHVDGSRAAVSLVVPVGELGRLGRDPAAPWRDLTPVAVGVADARLRIVTVSSDVREVLGFEPGDLIGRYLPDIVRWDEPIVPGDAPFATSVSHRRAQAELADGTWIELCVLVAAVASPPSAGVVFALITAPVAVSRLRSGRVGELEHRLKIIGAEVRAAGLLDESAELLSVADHPQLRELTTRQWEILSRLTRGDRVSTIAVDLYVSPSTVRNHLAAIFQKFGVHSQVELLAVLRQRVGAHGSAGRPR